IPKTALLNFAMPALAVIEPSSEPPEPLSETTESVERVSDGLGDNLQVVIVLGISVVAISIVYLLFRPSPEKAKEEAVSRRDFNDE
ncbi:MAG: hypothetical protein IJS67_05205, partial [Clostridia bacterium]|nr:hypothetical protein [Clostridia bacterium]